MLLNTTKATSDEITDHVEVSAPKQFTLIGSTINLPKISHATPLPPSVFQTITVKSTIQRNQYQHARAESLGPTRHQSFSSTEDYWNDCSETSLCFDDSMPSHLYTPSTFPKNAIAQEFVARPLKIIQTRLGFQKIHSGTSDIMSKYV
ncbi:hypothetical protein PGT21_027347 [Puccinia graminis f. sp. tritici]|uniref:Uncharacterized protein n=2 Tax=Puccinia graminis f. sp. tritici TaxID=56615 RepID=E3JS92_PUCGT|nr:uncharacterized protein PGTG_01606 [Puccinia graminis f. sp. tritici CRL 75-36-700-3]EFP75013.2 hypothetical protein PGTG_01606 [Puccinia graminis f. sp. tritici CRL 75-36-700-3]KAA1117919.1 hypothetical protein PGT21_027347 [Puccinia graminis f. sp. tritici]